jgi:hypothetical protein
LPDREEAVNIAVVQPEDRIESGVIDDTHVAVPSNEAVNLRNFRSARNFNSIGQGGVSPVRE